MYLAPWLKSIRNRVTRTHKRRRPARPTRRIRSEDLEKRTLLTVTGVAVGTELTVFVDSVNDITVQRNTTTDNIEILENGSAVPTVPLLDATTLTGLHFLGGDQDNSIDLSGLTATAFPALSTITVDTADGEDVIIGSDAFAESLAGGDGHDTITGNSGNDTLDGGDGDDSLLGVAGDDSLIGGNGADTLDGDAGDDTLSGGDGDDSLLGAAGDDSANGGQGADVIDGSTGNDSLSGSSGNDTITGDTGDDTVFGGADDDSILGGDGTDELSGEGGNDVISGEADDDTIMGNDGDDTLTGDAGNDRIIGNAGNDSISGGEGDDALLGGGGHDQISGDVGDDTISGNGGRDTLDGTSGADSIDGGAGDDVITSGAGDIPVVVTINDVNAAEGDSGTTPFSFQVSLSSPATIPVSVDYTTVDDSAISPDDFTARSGRLTFLPGISSLNVVIDVAGETVAEFHERFQVVLSNAVNAEIHDTIGWGTILADDGLPSVASSTTTAPAAASTALASALGYLNENAAAFGLTAGDIQDPIVTDQYASSHNGVTHLYLRQTYQGLPIEGADIAVAVGPDGTVLNAHSAFVPNLSQLQLSATPDLTAEEAFAALEINLPDVLEDGIVGGIGDHDHDVDLDDVEFARFEEIDDRLQWALNADGELELVWTINVLSTAGWFDTSVNAVTGEITSNAAWSRSASYNVVPANIESPLHGSRSIEVDPNDLTASPFGWHDTDGVAGAEFTDTRGNNVYAQGARNQHPLFDMLFTGNFFGADPRPDGGATLDFDFPFDDTLAPSTYADAATTNLFYTNNVLHDIHYHYGFDEVSGNFQFNNYGNGGLGGDQVAANSQSGANLGVANNAFMATPPDGFSPMMAMFEFNLTTPNRDSDLDNGVIIHEYGHGITNRLTGGPANASALTAVQSRGMGEGWSDFWALMLTQQTGESATDSRGIGNYVLGLPIDGPGIRSFPYSFDMTVNPLTFNDLNVRLLNGFPHDDGELWASTLWDMNWLLINGDSEPDCEGHTTPGYGFDPDLISGTGGNNIALQLVMDALKLQPANPSFLDARDAILMADMINFGGAHQDAIWTAFARRGMGVSADDGGGGNSVSVTAAFDLPPEMAGLQFDRASYSSDTVATLRVCDPDLAAVASTVTVTVTTDGGDSEDVVLNRVSSRGFQGSIAIRPAVQIAGNGTLDINAEAGLLSATYVDVTSLTGGSVTLNAFAAVFGPEGDTLNGGDGDDTITGGIEADLLAGGDGNDSLDGAGADDILLGGNGRDTVLGGDGDDTLFGQGADDRLDGGSGVNDIHWDGVNNGNDVIVESLGVNRLIIQGDDSADSYTVDPSGNQLRVSVGNASVVISDAVAEVRLMAGGGDDTVTVTSVADVNPVLLTIDGEAGDDVLTASSADIGRVRMRMSGGDGNDSIVGSLGNDFLNGDAGEDTISGSSGDDKITGGDGNDEITGDRDNDEVDGGLGNDTINGGLGNDSLNGSFDDDFILGDRGHDTINGGFGNDIVVGNAGHDVVDGNQGDDSVYGGAGDDSLDGGAGHDYMRGHSGNDVMKGGDGDDEMYGDNGDDTMSGGDGDDVIEGREGFSVIDGGDGNDKIVGGALNDTLIGGDGNDTIFGGAGNDRIFGGDGDDKLKGHGSTDLYNSGEGDDTLIGLTGNEFDNLELQMGSAILKALAALNGI